MEKKRKETRWGRTVAWWGIALILVTAFVAYPTQFKWQRWVYGLIWGLLTMVGVYLFRGFFEKDVNDH